MPVENVYQNIANILQRIESIKRRFGVSTQGRIPSGNTGSGQASGGGQTVSEQSAAENNIQGQETANRTVSRLSELQSKAGRVSSSIAQTSFRAELERKIAESCI